MNTFVCITLLAAVVVATPPQNRETRLRFQRQEVAEGAEDAPYPAAGYKPSKEFNLPSRQENAAPETTYGIPVNSYGAPFNTYLTPQTEYGVPEEKTETENEKKEVEVIEETKQEEKQNLEEKPNKDAEIVNSQGTYYVLLPGSQLQRVQFQTENDLRNMAYTARLQYRNEERAPLFIYTPIPQYQSSAYFQLYK